MPDPFATRLRTSLAHALGGRCVLCRAWSRGALCIDCQPAFHDAPRRCPKCASRTRGCCSGRVARPWTSAVAALDYAPPWRTLVTAFKFEGRVELSEVLAGRLARAVATAEGDSEREREDENENEDEDRIGQPIATPQRSPALDLVVPLPLAPRRLRERGYNQAWELARRVASSHGLPACADALFRVRDTPHQLALDRVRREVNLRDAFAVSPARATLVRGARIALVDDVLTTGATAAAATWALRRGGATEVRLWVLARTP